jgi:single-strand DNA-binding protein
MNKIILLGRLTREPEVRYSQGEKSTAIASFSVAVNRKFKREGEPEADFFNCTAFGKLGEFVEKYLRQGSKILLSGHIQNNNYTNKEGQKVYSVQVIAGEIEFAESKKQDESNKSEGPVVTKDGFDNIPEGIEEELPFM